ncbi:helix-loop-helix DNA-binding domain-containing protein [Biscogniauxia mediterranea]|nr:helix-loop-helix DNA-binding domain-containing protein [Biscogniauxia mediterranea]
MMDPGAWNGQDQNLSSTGDDDFHQFLDMGGMSNLGNGLPFDFQDFGASNDDASIMHSRHNDTLDTPMSDSNIPSIITQGNIGMQNHVSPMTSAPSHPAIPSQIMPAQTVNDAISEIDAQIQFLQQQRLQQQQRQLEEQQRRFREQQAAFYAQHHRNMVPPTPQSLEMQAANQFYTPQDQGHSSGMFDGYQHLKEQQDMAFTPLVSPAVTPLDTQFPTDTQFTVPGAYFSPITSPALHAQNDSTVMIEHRHLSHTTNSPVEMDIESPTAQASTANPSKKARKPSTKARKSNVRQSPITRPQRRKNASTPAISAQVLGELAESAAESSQAPPKPKSVSVASAEDSENASVSPEALSDMPPPPLPPPRSARQSPYIAPQAGDKPVPLPLPAPLNGKPSPATPASLFKISPRSKSTDPNHPEQHASDHIDGFELPESISFSRPEPPPFETQPTIASALETDIAKSTSFQTLPSPIFPKPPQSSSTSESPQLTPKTTPNPRKTPVMTPRGSKKRSSISSAHASPALLPKISPNIKPLLPGTPGFSAEDSASRLLASKSNYQRILEGSTVPGVSYPSELSTNLTSKRTSHKIAEQGRRNRINLALQEIATLLPTSAVKDISEGDGDSGSGDKKDNKQSNAPNSKASTVELAIEYIKQLQKDVATANKRAEEAERKLQEKAAS